MHTDTALAALSALSHAHRLGAFRALVQAGPAGMAVGDIRQCLDIPPATLSAHLNILRAAGLVTDVREGRVIRVSADFARMNALVGYLTENCCGGASCAPSAALVDARIPSDAAPASAHPGDSAMPAPVYNVLFLCTGNSARSVMAEALLGVLGAGRFHAYSAGSHPSGMVQPMAIDLAQSLGYPPDRLRSKSWDEFAEDGAPTMDIVITVCDNAACEACPVWLGHPAIAHWGVPDPVTVDGDDDKRRRAFTAAFATLRRRVELLLALPLDKLDRLATQSQLRDIGRVGAQQ